MLRVSNIEMVQKRLEYPLPANAVYWRIGQTGESTKGPWATALAYLDARAVRRRLTEIFGLAGWQTRMDRFGGSDGHGFICRLEVCIDGEWIERADTSDDTAIEAVKGGASKALVRAATNFGVGEYLYGLGRNYVQIVEKKRGAKFAKVNGNPIWWEPPMLPQWALPKFAPPADQQEIVDAGARLGMDTLATAEWVQARYGVTLDYLEPFCADDAVAFLAARAKDSA